MRLSRIGPLVCIVAGLCWVPDAGAQADPKFKFGVGGLLFGDLYKVASHHTEEGDGASGLVLRRGYLTFNADFSKNWFGRLRFEVNQAGDFETYTFDVDVKDLYVGRKLGRHRLTIGLSPPPTFDLIEAIWGLRSLVRTPMDLQGVASRDTGVAIKGPLTAGGTFSHRAMVGEGLNFGNETGDGRRWMGAVAWKPTQVGPSISIATTRDSKARQTVRRSRSLAATRRRSCAGGSNIRISTVRMIHSWNSHRRSRSTG